MYASFFGLQHEPFSIAPDPRFLYMSERHREALAHLMYGIRGNGGFVLLTGEIGAGKTTVCRAFLDQVPAECEVAYIFNPKLTVHELLKAVCDEFGITAPAAGTPGVTVQDYVEPLNRHLLAIHAAGRKSILIIDEAQNLEPEVLEQLRLLTNLETAERKLLQIMLIGQPELRDMVARPELEQLAQRIVARCHLGPLSPGETAQYVMHRMRVAGLGAASPFTARELAHIHKLTGGVPRRINLLCDRALLGAYSRGQAQVDRAVVRHAAVEVFDNRRMRLASERREVRRQLLWGTAIAVVAVGVGFGLSVWQGAGLDRGVSPGDRVDLSRAADEAARAGGSSAPAVTMPATLPSATPLEPVRTDASTLSTGRPAAADQPITGWPDEGSALRLLARNWGIDLPAGEGCEATRRVGVACYRTQASVVLARQLDRPALIRLTGPDHGTGQHALLLGIDNQQALLQLPEGRLNVPLAGLAVHWRGDYLTLWRAPEGLLGAGTSGVGATSAGKTWLDETLQRVPGLAEVAPGAAQDARVQARLQAFQVTQGLQPDGKVGPVTMMRLNQVVGIQEPRLQLSNAPEGR